MKRKVTINKSVSGAVNGRINIPAKLLEAIGITEEDRNVVIQIQGDRLVIEKLNNNSKDLVGKIYVEVTEEEREFLL